MRNRDNAIEPQERGSSTEPRQSACGAPDSRAAGTPAAASASEVLVVHGPGASGADLGRRLDALGIAVRTLDSYERAAIDRAAAARPDLALVCLESEGRAAAVDATNRLWAAFGIPVVQVLTDASEDVLTDAAAAPFGRLVEPASEAQLRLTVEAAIRIHRRERRLDDERARLQAQVDDMRRRSNLTETALESLAEGLIVADENGKYLLTNSTARRLTEGLDRSLPMEQRVEHYGFFDAADKKTPADLDDLPIPRALRGESFSDADLFMRNDTWPDGIVVAVSGGPVALDSSGRTGAIITFREVTRIRRIEEEHERIRGELERTVASLKRETALTEAVFASMGAAVLVVNNDGLLTKYNPLAERLLGAEISGARLVGWSERLGVFLPDDSGFAPTEHLPLHRATLGESTDNVELLIRNAANPDGVLVNVSGRPLKVPGEPHHGGVSVFRDVTKRKAAEAALENTVAELSRQTELMEAVFDKITDGIIVADGDGKFLYVNPGAQKITGLSTDDSVPREEWDRLRSRSGDSPERPFGTFLLDRETPLLTRDLPLVRALERGESVDRASIFVRNAARPDGAFLWATGRPLFDEESRIRGAVVTLREFTDEVLAEEAISRAFVTGRRAMVETVLHNVGNAINSVTVGIDTLHERLSDDPLLTRFSALASAIEANRGRWIEYIRDDPQGKQVLPFIVALAKDFKERNEDLQHSADRVRQSAQHIAGILRTRKMIGATKSVSLDVSLANAVRMVQETLDSRGIGIEVDCRGAPREIQVRESQLHQILVNLVKNAAEAIDGLRATGAPLATPLIRVRASSEGDDVGIEVSDNGIGFEMEDPRVLFSAGFSTKDAGSGLGLHSTAQFVRAVGGTIEAVSDGLGKGATIRIKVPLNA